MTEVAERRIIQLIVDGSQVKRAVDEVNRNLEAVAGSANSVRELLAGAFTGAIAAIAGGSLLHSIVNITTETSHLTAQLTTITGSTDKAREAMGALIGIAEATPFSVDEVTKAFTRLQTAGLSPSEDALTAFSSIAIGTGQTLEKFTEAAVKATQGAFKGLRAFGIQAKKEGNEIAFTFQGTTTRVANNARDIQGFLVNLGQTKFADAIKNEAASLAGTIDDAGDAWERLVRTLSTLGAESAIAAPFALLRDSLTTVNNLMASGLGADVAASLMRQLGIDGRSAIDAIADSAGGTGDALRAALGESIQFIGSALLGLPQNLKAAVQIMTVNVAEFVQNAVAQFSILGVKADAAFQALGAKAAGLLPGVDTTSDQQRIADEAAETIEGLNRAIDANARAADESRQSILAETDATRIANDALIDRIANVNAAAEATRSDKDRLVEYAASAGGAADKVNALTEAEKARASLQKDIATAKAPAFSDSASVAEALTTLNRAQSAISTNLGSDPDRARQELEIFREQVKALTEKGQISKFYAQDLATQAAALEAQAAEAVKLAQPVQVPVTLDGTTFAATLDTLRSDVQREIASKPLVIPVVFDTRGNTDPTGPGSDFLRREALKRGAPE